LEIFVGDFIGRPVTGTAWFNKFLRYPDSLSMSYLEERPRT